MPVSRGKFQMIIEENLAENFPVWAEKKSISNQL